jgi:hypothetical protein
MLNAKLLYLLSLDARSHFTVTAEYSNINIGGLSFAFWFPPVHLLS